VVALKHAFAIVILNLLIGEMAFGSGATFTSLGILSGYDSSYARDLSADGSTVVGYSTIGDGVSGGWIWTPCGGMVALAPPIGDTNMQAYGVSADGSVIVGVAQAAASPYVHGFQSTAQGGAVALGELPGGQQSIAVDVSANGSIVTGISGSSDAPNGEAFKWTNIGGLIGLGVLPGTNNSEGLGISADGLTIVGTSGKQAMLWTDTKGMVALPSLPNSVSSAAICASANGSVIDGTAQTSTSSEAFRWTSQSGTIDLGKLPGAKVTEAGGMNVSGSIVVGESGKAFIWTTATGMLDLQAILLANGATGLAGWKLTSATNISADGQFVIGSGTDPAGHVASWLAELPTFTTGDMNLDGVVNAQDIAIVASNWLVPGIGIQGDANGDGIVNGQDLALLSSNWMQTADAAASPSAVPEPSTLVLVATAAFALAACRRWHEIRPRRFASAVSTTPCMTGWSRGGRGC
jgi:probable HAF family extracellular repeat protein